MKAGLDHAGSLFLRAVVKRMKTMGLSQSELARRMHASRPYVVKVLRGDVNITLGSAARFAKALQMDFLPVLIDRNCSPEEKPYRREAFVKVFPNGNVQVK